MKKIYIFSLGLLLTSSTLFAQGILDTSLFVTNVINDQAIHFTLYKLLVITVCILSGFLFAFIFNRFVLKHIFQSPNDGIQNLVINIIRYLFIITSVLFSFLWADLGIFSISIGIAIATIGFTLVISKNKMGIK